MIHLLSFLFLWILLSLHFLGNPDIFSLPLSMFRDGGFYLAGIALFVLLIAVGGCLILLMLQLKRAGDCLILLLASFLLLIIAVTPSLDSFHLICSILLMGLLFLYYSMLIYHWKPMLLGPHLCMPLILLLVTKLDSYGIWQKSFIVYFLLLMNIHYLVLRFAAGQTKPKLNMHPARSSFPSKQKHFALNSQKSWHRVRARDY